MESIPDGALALVLLLDQFSRNIHRGDPLAFAGDARARAIAARGIARRFDLIRPPQERAFFYLPFMHSEDPADQRLSLRLYRARLSSPLHYRHAKEHADIVRRFGRFPHRNRVLGRKSTPEERQFLNAGGFSA